MATQRHLNKIYAFFDSEEYKQAYNACENAYERTRELIFEALRAQTLLKLNRRRDAYDLCQSLMAESPGDKATVLLLNDILKSLKRGDEAVDMLEAAFSIRSDEKIGGELMTCYVRQFKFSKQYYLALKLYKAFDRIQYAMWTVQSVCLLAHADPSQASVVEIGDLLLQRIKRKPEFKYTASILRLDLQMQALQGNHVKALRILEEFGQLLPTIEERQYFQADLHRRAGRPFDQLNALHGILCKGEPGPSVEEMSIPDAELRMDI